jgi:hypothetical protein
LYLSSGGQVTRNRFIFNQTSNVVLEHEDESGNKFKVSKIGKNFIMPVNMQGSQSGIRPPPVVAAAARKGPIKVYDKHAPRFFIIHKDSSGTELLRHEDVGAYLAEVEVDPMTAIIRDNLQGYPNIMGTTVLRPIKSKPKTL